MLDVDLDLDLALHIGIDRTDLGLVYSLSVVIMNDQSVDTFILFLDLNVDLNQDLRCWA